MPNTNCCPWPRTSTCALCPGARWRVAFYPGKFTRDQTNTGGQSRRDTFDFPVINKEKAYDIIDVLMPIAEGYQVSAAEVALAWVRQQKGVTSTIIGAKTKEQLLANIHSTTFYLTPEELNKLDEVSKPEQTYPGWMVERQMGDRFPAE